MTRRFAASQWSLTFEVRKRHTAGAKTAGGKSVSQWSLTFEVRKRFKKRNVSRK